MIGRLTGLWSLVLVKGLALIAVWAIARGLIEIAGAIALRKVIEGEWLLALSGMLSVGFGLLLLIRPGQGALALITVIGLYLMLFGAITAALALRLRSLRLLVHA